MIAAEHRRLRPALADALARVRTDLDSFSPYLIDLLIAQAYFLTNAHVRLSMPDILPVVEPGIWNWAEQRIAQANANEKSVLGDLQAEAIRYYIRSR